jgi:hypothetical protein
MTNPQKAKGLGFEQEIAKYLTEKYGESFICTYSKENEFTSYITSSEVL